MTRRLVQDRAAYTDLVGIWEYSFEQWGEEQADRYIAALARGMNDLADEPESGSPCDELRDSYWSSKIEHHIVFYTFTDAELRIRRVLHESMDVERHL